MKPGSARTRIALVCLALAPAVIPAFLAIQPASAHRTHMPAHSARRASHHTRAQAARGSRHHRARAGRAAVQVKDAAHLHLRKAYGPVLIEEGNASGTLPGHTWARLVVKTSVHATFTIRTRAGKIKGTGRASLHSTGRYASFGGSLTVTGGSGRYASAHGHGHLYGVIDRRTHAVTVKTTGTLHY